MWTHARTDGRTDARTPARVPSYKLTLWAFGSGELKTDRSSNKEPFAYFASSANWATEPHGRCVTICPCSIRSVPDTFLLAVWAEALTEPWNITGEEKAQSPTRTRTQDLSHTLHGHVMCYIKNINEPGHGKFCLMPYANNRGTDQPAHPRSLISVFFVRC